MLHGSDQDASLRSMILNGGSDSYRPWIWRDYGNIQVADLNFYNYRHYSKYICVPHSFVSSHIPLYTHFRLVYELCYLLF
jgi:hypothetical protein